MAKRHTFKVLDQEFTEDLTQRRAIRYQCLDCSGGVKADIKDCNVQTCPLFPFRPFQRKAEAPEKGVEQPL
jgi:hypothetical protein